MVVLKMYFNKKSKYLWWFLVIVKVYIYSNDGRGVSLCRDGLKVTYLSFADDKMLFCRASQQECTTILEILQLYEVASGQQINKDKTHLFFSSNIDQTMRDQIKTAVGVLATTHIESYLGVPSFVGRAKKQSFNYIREQIWHKIQEWKEKLLSRRVGKFWSKRCSKPCQPTPWVASYYQNPYARISKL